MEKKTSLLQEYWFEVLLSSVLLIAVGFAWADKKISAETAEVIDVLTATFALNFALLKGKFAASSESVEASLESAKKQLEDSFRTTAESLVNRRSSFETKANEIAAILEKLGGTNFEHAVRFVDDALEKLRLIPQGIIHLDPSSYYNELTDQLRKAVSGAHVFAVSSRPIERWENNPRQENYFNENVSAIGRGVIVHRVFVVERSKMTGSYPALVAEVLHQQINAGVDVGVVWNESLWQDSSLCEDFVLFEGEGVVFTDEGERVDTTRVVSGNLISDPQQVKKFRKRFKSLSETYRLDKQSFEKLLRNSI